MWSNAYCLEVTVHQILTELCLLKFFVNISFPGKSSCRLHLIKLKLDVLLDHDVEQCRCNEVAVHQKKTELCPLNISVNFLFLSNSSYSLNQMVLKLDLR